MGRAARRLVGHTVQQGVQSPLLPLVKGLARDAHPVGCLTGGEQTAANLHDQLGSQSRCLLCRWTLWHRFPLLSGRLLECLETLFQRSFGPASFFSISRDSRWLSGGKGSFFFGSSALSMPSIARFCHWPNSVGLMSNSWQTWALVRRSLQIDNTAVIFCCGSNTLRVRWLVFMIYILSCVVHKFFLTAAA
jgi:hypothetical protein